MQATSLRLTGMSFSALQKDVGGNLVLWEVAALIGEMSAGSLIGTKNFTVANKLASLVEPVKFDGIVVDACC